MDKRQWLGAFILGVMLPLGVIKSLFTGELGEFLGIDALYQGRYIEFLVYTSLMIVIFIVLPLVLINHSKVAKFFQNLKSELPHPKG